MPYGGGIFLPSESAYKDPNRFKDVLQAEGNKEAQYLSSMDQFYEQLNEMKREFDITSAQKERFFEENLAFGKEKLAFTGEQSALNRSLRRWEVGQQTGVQREQIGVQRESVGVSREATQLGFATNLAKLGLEKEKFAETQSKNQFMRGLYAGEESRRQTGFDTTLRALGGSPETTTVGGGRGGDLSGNYYSPFSGESISDFMNTESYY